VGAKSNTYTGYTLMLTRYRHVNNPKYSSVRIFVSYHSRFAGFHPTSIATSHNAVTKILHKWLYNIVLNKRSY